jgi:hypothetical protein
MPNKETSNDEGQRREFYYMSSMYSRKRQSKLFSSSAGYGQEP